LFATCNPPEYAGTKEMNKALLSRFAVCINVEFPTEKVELDIIQNHLGNAVASSEMAIKLVGLANETRKAKEMGNADYAINTRDILNTLKLAEFMEPLEALSLAFSNKLDMTDNKALRAIAKLHLPSSKKKGNATRKPVASVNDLTIGNTYVLDNDTHNAYLGITDDHNSFERTLQSDLGSVIANNSREDGIKGDEFVVNALFFEDVSAGASNTEVKNAGAKVASAITFVSGPNKGKQAVICHHQDIENSIAIIQSLCEIS